MPNMGLTWEWHHRTDSKHTYLHTRNCMWEKHCVHPKTFTPFLVLAHISFLLFPFIPKSFVLPIALHSAPTTPLGSSVAMRYYCVCLPFSCSREYITHYVYKCGVCTYTHTHIASQPAKQTRTHVCTRTHTVLHSQEVKVEASFLPSCSLLA